jgi:hypothetical protein
MTTTLNDKRKCQILTHPAHELIGIVWLHDETWACLWTELIVHGDGANIAAVAGV